MMPAAMVLGLSLSLLAAGAGTPQVKSRPSLPAAASGLTVEPAALSALKARPLGPAVMGGRVSDIAYDPVDPYTFYVALGTGGLWKTSDSGASFKAVFEKETVASTGAVAVAPSDPKVIWLGTGEANDRNSSGWGNGVYLSTDAGATWKNVGLKASKAIARIVVHPQDPKTAWVAAMGDLWGPSGERGLYVTNDGGTSWRALLTAPKSYADRVGCGDVVVDPGNPAIIYAALYARVRTPWSFTSGVAVTDGKDLGGIFKTTDEGVTWRKLEKGLPTLTQRIGLTLFPKNSNLLYAVVQSEEGGTANIDQVTSKRGGIFRTEDGGETWIRVNPLNPRPFYFSQIRVDPENDRRLYVLGYGLHVSEDGGETFREDRFGKVHPDNHALAIDPRTPKRLLLGTDGGPYQSFDGGATWQHLNTQDAGEYYRINLDMSTPYRICGGLQDNLNWVGPSRTYTKDGILNSDWMNIGGGDGFYCVFDPDDPDVVYAEAQQGELHRFHMKTGQMKSLRPEPAEGQPAYRFHWNSPLLGSRHHKGVLYLGGNHVFRLADKGEVWKRISPDLSSRELGKMIATGSGAENYGVVYALAESPIQPGLLWAGTDDGKLWVTENEGEAWTDLTSFLPPAIKSQWLGRLEPGAHDAKVAYLSVDAHRTLAFAPLLFRTADMGRTWQSIASNLPPQGPVKAVREDPRNPDLLYVGTEFGLFVSFDRGDHWQTLGDLPTVAVDDILVHPRDNDLVIATHGRSLFIIDDITALQGLTREVVEKEAHLFPPRPALALPGLPGWIESQGGSGIFRGANPPEGALLDVFLRKYTGNKIEIEISNVAQVPVARLSAPGAPGLNRIVWDLKPSKEMLSEYGGEGRKFVRAGEYTVRLSYGKTKQEQKLRVDVAPGVETR